MIRLIRRSFIHLDIENLYGTNCWWDPKLIISIWCGLHTGRNIYHHPERCHNVTINMMPNFMIYWVTQIDWDNFSSWKYLMEIWLRLSSYIKVLSMTCPDLLLTVNIKNHRIGRGHIFNSNTMCSLLIREMSCHSDPLNPFWWLSKFYLDI